jgi:two-component system cell cycle response regulator
VSPSSPLPPPPDSSRDDDALSVPTPLAVELRDTQQVLVRARVAVERRTLTVIGGTQAGQSFTLSAAQHVIGRGDSADFRVADPDVSRLHARVSASQGGGYAVDDLKSMNGTFVNGQRIKRCQLSVGDRIQCGPHLVLRFAVTDDIEEELHRRMFESSTHDQLTRAFNRRYLMQRLAGEVAHARRHAQALAVVAMDPDGFRRVNDVHGHLVGDVVLRAIAARAARIIRTEDVFARYSSARFAILSRAINKEGARALAERLRTAIHDLEIPVDGPPIRLTASFGAVSIEEVSAHAPHTDLLSRADARVSLAKSLGRDRVCVSDG